MHISQLTLLASTLGLTMGAASAQNIEMPDYWPIEAGYSWKAVDPNCATPCSCFALWDVDVLAPHASGPNAFLVGEDLSDATVFENTGSSFIIHGFMDNGAFFAPIGGAIAMGSIADGSSYDLDGQISVMVRRWSAVTSPDKPLYGIDGSQDVISLSFYDTSFVGTASPHVAVMESGLPAGTIPPAGSIDEVWWLTAGEGIQAIMEIQPDPAAPNAFGPWPPVLDARLYPSFDCNGNGIIDRIDIATGTSQDVNQNCIPDECQSWSLSCPPIPNTSGLAATLGMSNFGSGIGSDFHLECTDGPVGEFGFFIISSSATSAVSLFDGVLCLDLPFGRYNPQIATNQGLPVLNSLAQFDAFGTLYSLAGNATSSGGSGFDVPLELPLTPAGQSILPGSTWNFQCWYRDGASANFSDVAEVTFL